MNNLAPTPPVRSRCFMMLVISLLAGCEFSSVSLLPETPIQPAGTCGDDLSAIYDDEGDCDGDGRLNAVDLCPRIDVMSNNLSEADRMAHDVDSDGDGVGDLCEAQDPDDGSILCDTEGWVTSRTNDFDHDGCLDRVTIRGDGTCELLVISNAAWEDYDRDNNGLIEICTIDDLRTVVGPEEQQCNKITQLLETIVIGIECIGYELVANLDFADAGLDTNPWTPIGTEDLPFIKTFEGNGYAISNLSIEATTEGAWGLFGLVSATGAIRDLLLRNIAITVSDDVNGEVQVGSMAGRLDGVNALIQNSAVIEGTIHGGAGNDKIGGMIGSNRGTVTDSYRYATTAINGGAGGDQVGGLVGDNERGTIRTSYAVGAIDGGTNPPLIPDQIGGLTGYNGTPETEGTIENAYYSSASITNGEDSGAGIAHTLVDLRRGTPSATFIYIDWSIDNWNFGTIGDLPVIIGTNGMELRDQTPIQ